MQQNFPLQLPPFLPAPNAMLFNSAEYLLVFLPLTAWVYFLLNRHTCNLVGKSWLVFASLFFYGWWSVSYLWLIGGSILVNYATALALPRLHNHRAKQTLLGAVIIANLGLLGYYKYADFFIRNINHWVEPPLPLLQLALPLGISFFTFTQIAFLVDVYREKAREYNFIHYTLFVTFFPHLIAGPILHHAEMMPQFSQPTAWKPQWHNIRCGLFIFAVGLLKKSLLADSLAVGANIGFNSTQPVSFLQAWLSSLSYTLQLYFDFSGYTDMAIGAALLFNIRLPENFNSPYKAKNIREFWQCWHITLSRWLRDYLYIPLGGNKNGALRMYTALLITFLLGGFWHGANWTFIIWGVLHGIVIVWHRIWQKTLLQLPKALSIFLTFSFVNIAWIFFRSSSITSATQMLVSMMGLRGLPAHSEITEIIGQLQELDFWNPLADVAGFPARQTLLLILGFFIITMPNTEALTKRYAGQGYKTKDSLIVYSTIGISVFYILFLSSGLSPFIYFYF